MKKIVSILTIFALLSIVLFSTTTFAAALDTIDVQTSKTLVRPGEEVNFNINFGKQLASYTLNIAYDDEIFDYVGANGVEGNASNKKVIVSYFDNNAPRDSQSVTFRAKSDITTSNPTELTLTATGLASVEGGATVTYDDITTPIVKNLTVEPEYVDYTLSLETSAQIVKGQEIPMTLSYSSPMGRYYEHARLIAQATEPTGENVRLLATDAADLEHDIIESGWGDAQGYKIGGKDVSQVLQTRAIFSNAGDYTITLKLIDRDNSDTVIASKTFSFTAFEEPTSVNPPAAENQQPSNPQEPEATPETPQQMPKTGENIYLSATGILVVLAGAYAYINKKK